MTRPSAVDRLHAFIGRFARPLGIALVVPMVLVELIGDGFVVGLAVRFVGHGSLPDSWSLADIVGMSFIGWIVIIGTIAVVTTSYRIALAVAQMIDWRHEQAEREEDEREEQVFTILRGTHHEHD